MSCGWLARRWLKKSLPRGGAGTMHSGCALRLMSRKLVTYAIVQSSRWQTGAFEETAAVMSQDHERRERIVTVSFLWGAMALSYMIRYALGIVAPTLMSLYNFSPATMGYILS